MKLPPSIVNELLKKNIDEADIVELLFDYFSLDKSLKPKVYRELVEILLSRSCELIEKGEYDEAANKIYKATELLIRAIALSKNLEEAKNAESNGWTPMYTERVAEKVGLSTILSSALNFYERKPDKDELESFVKNIKRVITSCGNS